MTNHFETWCLSASTSWTNLKLLPVETLAFQLEGHPPTCNGFTESKPNLEVYVWITWQVSHTISWNSGRMWVEVSTQHWSFLIWTQQLPSRVSLYSAGTAACVGQPRLLALSEPPASAGGPYLKHLCFRRGKKKVAQAISCWPAVPRSSRECDNMTVLWAPTFKRTSVTVFLLLLEIPSIPTSTLLLHFTNRELSLLQFSSPSYSLSPLCNHNLISLGASFSPDVI